MFAGFTGGLVRLRETLKSEEADPPRRQRKAKLQRPKWLLATKGAGGSDRRERPEGSGPRERYTKQRSAVSSEAWTKIRCWI